MAISLSSGVRQALSSLQSTQADARVSQTRLATGKKVNSALDNPTSFFTASGLSNRASDLGKLLDNMGQAIKTLEAADKGIKAISKLVENAQSLANQAKATTESKAAVSAQSAAAARVTGTADLSSFSATGGETIQLSVAGGATQTITLTAGDNATAVAAAVAGATGVTAAISSNNLQITADNTTDSITIVGGTGLSALGLTAGTTNATPAVAAQSAVSADASRSKLATDFATIRTQIDQLVKDSGYNGVNLLNGDTLAVTFNEKGSSKLDIAGKTSDTSASGLNVRAAQNSWASNTDVQAALDDLKAATDTLRASASSFGASLSIVQNRQDFTKGMIDTLNNGSDELTIADSNQEGANLLALNTRAQLSQTALSLASQQDQAVLRLF